MAGFDGRSWYGDESGEISSAGAVGFGESSKSAVGKELSFESCEREIIMSLKTKG